ncbi:hypothetical protein [Pseudoflavitalea rhizosphaerae]|uniref:hypothetical protein n=1 Tax=Pseudoflavitalea rhizosphaerae TaxID=1884793 RepID=UPI000F8EF36B|nr:hypothetical protein [Pseudoflavitalea rhizosphaerae]
MGKSLIGVFIPPFIAVVYLTYTGYKYSLNRKLLIKTLLLYFIQITPFLPVFLQTFQPTPANDFARYYLYAKNMFDNNTLWGGDQLFYDKLGRGLVTQPGYRYFIFLELLVFRDLYRIVSFFNITLLIIGIYCFLRVIHELTITGKFKKAILVLVVLITPFAIKNLLMGMPEWLTACLFMGCSYFLVVRRNELAAVFLLGLIPFFRQNLVITALLLLLYILVNSKERILLFITFFLVLLLPLYHNLYYAGEWKFFVDLLDYPFYNYTPDKQISGYNINLLINNIVHYFGIDISGGRIEVSFIGAIFLPYSVILFFLMFRYLYRPAEKIFYFLITMSAVGPAILMANAYYPRFEFMNVIVMMICFAIINAAGYKAVQALKNPGIAPH